MVIKQLEPAQYTRLCKALCEKANAEPLEAFYTVGISVSGVDYSVRVQPEEGDKIAVLQAYQIDRDADGQNFALIREEGVLSAFLELLVYQGVR